MARRYDLVVSQTERARRMEEHAHRQRLGEIVNAQMANQRKLILWEIEQALQLLDACGVPRPRWRSD